MSAIFLMSKSININLFPNRSTVENKGQRRYGFLPIPNLMKFNAIAKHELLNHRTKRHSGPYLSRNWKALWEISWRISVCVERTPTTITPNTSSTIQQVDFNVLHPHLNFNSRLLRYYPDLSFSLISGIHFSLN